MLGRRQILKSLLAGILFPPLANALPAGGETRREAAGQQADFHIVNGWILTGRDLAGMGLR